MSANKPKKAADPAQQRTDEDAIVKKISTAARNANYRAVRDEIDQRDPGIRRLMRQIDSLMEAVGTDDNFSEARARLVSGSPDAPVSERTTSLSVRAEGPRADVLRAILEAGVSAYLAVQPDVACTHCGQRILSPVGGPKTVWWHIDSTVASCDQGTTTAEPATPKEK